MGHAVTIHRIERENKKVKRKKKKKGEKGADSTHQKNPTKEKVTSWVSKKKS